MFSIRLLAATLAGLFSASLGATDLMTSWQAARLHDATFAAANAGLRAAQQQGIRGNALLLPQVGLVNTNTYVSNVYQAGQPSVTQSATTSGGQYATTLSVSQPLYNVGAVATRDQYNKQVLQAEVLNQAAEQDLILRVAKAYFDVLAAQENVALVSMQKEAVAQQLAYARKAFAVGVSTIVDSNEAQARFDAIVASEITAANELAIRQSVFHDLTTLEATHLLPVTPNHPPGAAEDPMAIWVVRASHDSLPVLAQQLGVQIAERDIDRYRLENTPVLSLVGTYGGAWDASGLSKSGRNDRTIHATIGLQLIIPLYTGGSRNAQLEQAIALRDQQAHSLQAVQRDAEQATIRFYLNQQSGIAQIAALERARISSASSVASSRRGLQVGVRTTIDVLNAEQTHYQNLYNLVLARYQFLLNKLQLAASGGRLDAVALASVNGWLASNAAAPY